MNSHCTNYLQLKYYVSKLVVGVGGGRGACADNTDTRGGSNFGVNSLTYYLNIHHIRALTEHIPMDLEPAGMCAVHSVTKQQMTK